MSNFKKGAVVLSVDDGRVDNYRFYQLLVRYAIPATFNIVTSCIGESDRISKEQLVEIYNDPLMEIACHGHTHKNTDEDILLGNKHLFEWLGAGDGKIGFASPGSNMGKSFVVENTQRLCEMGLLYVRSAYNPEPNARHRELVRKLQSEGAPSYLIENVPQLIYDFSDMFVPSAVVYNTTDVEHLKALADLAAEERACVVFMFHRIKKQGEKDWDNTWSYDFDKTEEFLKHIKQKQENGELDLLTTRSVYEQHHTA